ncbi:MAG: 2OG-Fe(II) oxygenase [Symploca sp. SIO3E6]|nr:2OG-Fe(II) oxygenase [Caldora sp. SIO3E6]
MELQEQFKVEGYFLQENFLSSQECENLLKSISDYRQQFFIPKVYRNVKPIPLSYSVIDGKAVNTHLPEIQKLYETVNQVINNLTSQQFFPLKDVQVECNVNITEQGGTYRWHYDRNAVTALLYLNEVEGGEIEFYPNYRIILPKAKFSKFQSFLDQIQQFNLVRSTLGKRIVVKPQPGLVLIMCGDRCLHSVRPVTEAGDRVSIVMAYDLPNASFAVKDQLNTYLYSSEKVAASDPNYSQSGRSPGN